MGERVVTVIFLLLHLSASDHVHSIHLTLLSNSLPCVSVTLVREEDEALGMGFPGGPEAYLLWKGPSSWCRTSSSQAPLPAISGATCCRGPSRCSAAWMRSADHACQGLRPPVGTASPSPPSVVGFDLPLAPVSKDQGMSMLFERTNKNLLSTSMDIP